jgi:hypothetical protein
VSASFPIRILAPGGVPREHALGGTRPCLMTGWRWLVYEEVCVIVFCTIAMSSGNRIGMSLHCLLLAVQRASRFVDVLIIHNMPHPFRGLFKRKKKDGLATTTSHQSTSSVSSLAASSTPVRMSWRIVRSA